ncbi:hypothetical protein [Nesterenkonia pannonica]|uniref:hypothetical protein n=1 Tax=Nesterenkonia pannonica TaxID=1548602 RepID=UPI002164A8F1|nr:hypothetical protein [Nesterenkonia pannonica]
MNSAASSPRLSFTTRSKAAGADSPAPTESAIISAMVGNSWSMAAFRRLMRLTSMWSRSATPVTAPCGHEQHAQQPVEGPGDGQERGGRHRDCPSAAAAATCCSRY